MARLVWVLTLIASCSPPARPVMTPVPPPAPPPPVAASAPPPSPPPPPPVAAPVVEERLPDDGSRVVAATGHQGQITSIVATPDGAFAATLALDRIVRVIQRDGLREIARFVAGQQPQAIALANDGARIAIAYGAALVIADVKTGRELGRIDGARACFAFDGGDLIFWRDGPVRWKAGTVTQLATSATACLAMGFTSATTLVVHDGAKFHAGDVSAGAWSARPGPVVAADSLSFGPGLVAWTNGTGVHVWRPRDPAPRTVLGSVTYGDVAVVDNGAALIYRGGKTQRIVVATGATSPFPERANAIAFGSGTVISGDEVLCTAGSQTGAVGACAPFASTGPVRSLAVAADGRLIVGADQASLRAWTLGFPVSVQEYSFRTYRTRVGDAVLSPDRKSIAQISNSEGVFVRPVLGDQRRELAHRPDPSYAGLAWSPDGTWIATTWRESIVRLRADGKSHELVENVLPKVAGTPAWYRRRGTPDTLTTRSASNARPLAYRRDGALLAVGAGDRVLLVRGDKVAATLVGPGGDEPPTALAFRAGTNELVVGFADGHVRSWNTEAPGVPLRDRDTGAAVAALAFDESGAVLLVASDDARVRVFDADQIAPKQTLAPHATTALALAFLPRGRIATGHVDGAVRILKLGTTDPGPLAELIPLDLQPNDRADWLVVGPDGRFEASLDGDGVAFYGVRDGRVVPFADFAAARRRPAVLEAATLDPADRPQRRPRGPTVIAQRWSRSFHALVFTPDGRELFARTETGVYAFDVASGLVRARLADGRGDGALAVSNSAFYRTVRDLEVRDRVTGDLVASQRHDGTIIGRTPAGELVARAYDGIAVYSESPFQRLRGVAEKDVPPGAASALSPDGAIIAATRQDGIVRTWATATLKERPPVRCAHDGDAKLAISSGGAWLACANARGGIVAVRGDGTGALVLRPSALLGSMQTIYAMSFHPTRPLLAVATLSGGYVYDLGKLGSELRLQAEDTRYDTIAWSPDGATLAMSQLGGALLLFDAATGALLRTLTDRVVPIDRIARARPGVIALRDASYHLRTWDAATGHERGFEGGHKFELAFSADGKTSAIEDGSAKVVVANANTTVTLSLKDVAQVALDAAGKRVFVGTQPILGSASEVAAYDVATQRQLWTQHHDMKLKSLVRAEDGGDLGMYFETKVPVLQPGHHRAIVLGPDGQVRGTYDSPWLMGIAGAGGAWMLVDNQRLSRWDPKTNTVDRTTIPAHAVAVSIDGVRAVAVGERELHVVDIKTLATIAFARLPDAKLTSGVWLAADLIATLVDDGTVKLWRLRGAALELAGTLYAVPRRGSVLVAPEGYYLASSEAADALGFALGPQVYRFDQFDAAYNRPHLALGALGVAQKSTLELYQAAYEKRRKHGVAEVTLANRLAVPAVELAEPLPLRVTGATVAVKLRADGKQTAIARVNIRVNGVPVLGKSGLAVTDRSTKFEVARDVPLETGPNRIELEAENDQGIVALGRTAIVTRAGATAKPGALHLITIGVSKYAEGNNLQYAAKDAEDVARALSKHAGVVQKVVLRDEQVTRATVLGLRKQLEQTALEDTVIVFAAGHGLLDAADQYVFGTHDLRFATAERGIKFDELEALLDGIPARRRILILDTCHAGELDAEELAHLEKAERAGTRGIRRIKAPPIAPANVDPRARAVAARQLFTNLRGGSGVTVIAASAGAEYSYELGAIKNGLFTHALIEGVEGGKADHDRDGAILVSELLDFVTITVAEASNGFQVPQTRQRNRELDFDLTPARPHRVPLQYDHCGTTSYGQPFAGYQCGALLANTGPLAAGTAPAAALDKLAAELAPNFPKHLAVTWTAATIPGVKLARGFIARAAGYPLDAHAGWIAVDPATQRQAVCIATDALPAAAERCKQVLPRLLLAAPPQQLY